MWKILHKLPRIAHIKPGKTGISCELYWENTVVITDTNFRSSMKKWE
jgi:hypothetical protein